MQARDRALSAAAGGCVMSEKQKFTIRSGNTRVSVKWRDERDLKELSENLDIAAKMVVYWRENGTAPSDVVITTGKAVV